MTALELGIAWRYLRGGSESRLLSFISVIAILGVVVGVSALIIVMGVMNGLQIELREKILTGSPDVRVLAFGADLKIDDWPALARRIRGVEGVEAASPFVLTQGVITGGRATPVGAHVAGIEPEVPGRLDATTIRQFATLGNFRFASSDGQPNGAVVGRLLATRLKVGIGDTVRVLTTGAPSPGDERGSGVHVQAQFEVTGLFHTGMFEYDDGYLFVSLEAGQSLAGLETSVTGIDVRAATRLAAPALARRLSDTLGYPYRTVDWQEQNSTLFQALRLQKLGMTVILLLIALVAAFTIVSNLTMFVAEKTREIGILRAMGMTARSVGRIFIVQGLIVGVVGTAVGVVLGLFVSAALGQYQFVKLDPAIYFIDHLPVATDPRDLMLTVMASILIAGIATISPARAAARLFPVEAIRHE